MPSAHPSARGLRALTRAVDALPYGVAAVDPHGVVRDGSRELTALCGTHAVGHALAALVELPAGDLADVADDTLVTLSSGRTAWMTVRPVDGDGHVVCLRAAELAAAPQALDPPRPLRVFVLGRCRVETATAPALGGAWLEQRAGQLLRLLVAARGRVLTVDEIADALWDDADARAATTVRYVVHTLRDRLEPARPSRTPSRFIVSHRGGYALAGEDVVIDADVFEREARDGLSAYDSGGAELARRLLERATSRFRGDFLADEPYADWAASERERLRELHARALRALADLATAAGDLGAAAERLAALVELEPLDLDAQRALIELCLRRGRRGEAVRRYAALRARTEEAFGEAPGFTLRSLSGAARAS